MHRGPQLADLRLLLVEDIAQLLRVELALKITAHGFHHPPGLAVPPPRLRSDMGKSLRSNHQQGHHQDEEDLGEADIEHSSVSRHSHSGVGARLRGIPLGRTRDLPLTFDHFTFGNVLTAFILEATGR